MGLIQQGQSSEIAFTPGKATFTNLCHTQSNANQISETGQNNWLVLAMYDTQVI